MDFLDLDWKDAAGDGREGGVREELLGVVGAGWRGWGLWLRRSGRLLALAGFVGWDWWWLRRGRGRRC